MSAIPITGKQMTLEEYIEFDRNAEGRFEYFDGEIFELSGGTPEHSLLASQIGFLLRREINSKGCPVYNSDVLIKVPALPPYRYADVSALCGKAIYEEIIKQRCLVNPTLIVEVLSESTKNFDCGAKFKAYKSIESFREYLLVEQNKKFVTLYTKYNEKFWLQSEYEASETLKLESLDCELNVDEIYQGIFEA